MENIMDSNIVPDTRYKTYQSNPRAWERHEYTAASYSPRQPRENRSYRQEYNSYDNPARRDVAHGVTHPHILQHPRQKDNQTFQPRRGYQDPGRLFQQDNKLFNSYESRNDDTPAPRNAGYHQDERQDYWLFNPQIGPLKATAMAIIIARVKILHPIQRHQVLIRDKIFPTLQL